MAHIDGVCVCLHPGVVKTELTRYMGMKVLILKVLLWPMVMIMIKTPWEGAQTTLYTVLEDDENLEKGAYYSDCKVMPSTAFTCDRDNATLLWSKSEE